MDHCHRYPLKFQSKDCMDLSRINFIKLLESDVCNDVIIEDAKNVISFLFKMIAIAVYPKHAEKFITIAQNH